MIDAKMKSLDINGDESINIELKSVDNSKKIEISLIETSQVNDREKEDLITGNQQRDRLKSKSLKTDGYIYKKLKKSKSGGNVRISKTEKSPVKDSENKEIEIKKEHLIEIIEPAVDGGDKDEGENIKIPRVKRCLIFICIVFVNIVVNLDEGNFPAATVEIQTDLKISSSQLGLFGSLQYAGNLIGKKQ